jgi:penicillin G amidase
MDRQRSVDIVIVPPDNTIPAAVLIVPRRNHGPIITLNRAAGTAISVNSRASAARARCRRSAASIAPATSISSSRRYRASTSVAELIYAGKDGDIAYFAAGKMPLREDLENGEPVGLPPFLIRDGRGGNVLNVLRPSGGIRYIGSGYSFDLGVRAGRMEQLLTSSLASGR